MPHRALARSIFVPSMNDTRMKLMNMGLFKGYVTTDLAVAAMKSNHTGIDYLCQKMTEMAEGKCKLFSRTELRAVLSMPNSKGLAHLFNEVKNEEEEQFDDIPYVEC